ncbi:hypothetical protein Geob_2473 [Geotalea daltonii FRC-32]|uniref:Uncharacterized protein n=1 Tax=Geotalea daltonii (strain DSM 22248 / JCM 15807 / FRC-32) TaxID=316067 RepID=B9M046_GEODF|nr:hypothetical protein [Geotalea daltonii]ACM20826.1 hypothetical protein Geob_2473 [Geotalea daltonii FRC-32]
MNWKKTLIALFIMIPAFAVCTPNIATASTVAGDQNRDVSFSLEIKQVPGNLAIKGLARNNLHHKIYQLQLFAVVLDENGKPSGNEAVFIGPASLALDQSQQFNLTLPGNLSMNARNIRLEYRYHLPDYAERYWSWTYGRIMITPEGDSKS